MFGNTRVVVGQQRFRVGDKINLSGDITSIDDNLVTIKGEYSTFQIPFHPIAVEPDTIEVGDRLTVWTDNPLNEFIFMPKTVQVQRVADGWVYVDGFGPYPVEAALRMFHSRPEKSKELGMSFWEYARKCQTKENYPPMNKEIEA